MKCGHSNISDKWSVHVPVLINDKLFSWDMFSHLLLGPLTRYAKLLCGWRMRQECWERFPRQRLQRKPLVSDPSMHHGTCVVMHVGMVSPWWRAKRSCHSRRMRNPRFYACGKRTMQNKIIYSEYVMDSSDISETWMWQPYMTTGYVIFCWQEWICLIWLRHPLYILYIKYDGEKCRSQNGYKKHFKTTMS